ncbi:TonB-dependent receptor [Devosia sp.]|uniref:TonB-dependent receptor domain-containing protein n=1 Tax=Devosia sp. TaxID=1871048 RepID=UPI0025BB7C12|nr:TonB-dependent receptor [Devosia sp.]
MSQGAAAQTPVNATYVTLLERLVIGLGGAPKVAIDTPQAVTVVTGDDIDQLQATTTGDIFATVPGVTIVGSERQLGEAFNIRGIGTTENSSDAARIVVNIDGQPKFFEQYRMGSFFSDPELYKQVEVLRGPASSTLYGAGAIGGVINFTTKDASDYIKDGHTGALRLKQTFDSNGSGTLTSAVLAQQINDTFEILAAGNWRRTNEIEKANGTPLSGSEFNSLSGLIKGTAHFGDNDEQTLTASYQRFNSQTDKSRYSQTGVMAGDPFGYIDRDVIDQTGVIKWSNPAADNPWLDLNLALSFSDTLNMQRNHRATPGGPVTNYPAPSTFADTDYQYRTWQLTGDNTIEWIGDGFENYTTIGFQASTQDRLVNFPPVGHVPVGTHPEGTENKLGLFVQNEFILDDRLTLLAGVRGDFHEINPTTAGLPSRSDSAFSPKLAALYAFNDNLSVFASIAHTQRLPTLDELYSSSASKTTSLGLLKERANTVEGGFAISGSDLLMSGDSAALKTTVFYNHIQDMIASNGTAVGVPYYGNVAEAELYGVEVEAAYDSEWAFANLALSVTTGNNLITNAPLTTVPQSKVVATLGGKHPEWNLAYGARLTVAANGEYIISPGDGTAEGFSTVDLFASWKPESGPLAGTQVQFGVDNLFNANYRENLAYDRSAGRTFKVSLSRQFDY